MFPRKQVWEATWQELPLALFVLKEEKSENIFAVDGCSQHFFFSSVLRWSFIKCSLWDKIIDGESLSSI